jgi:hypothetical protein
MTVSVGERPHSAIEGGIVRFDAYPEFDRRIILSQ